jgi:ribulose-phosphate 3-epimerase
VLESVVNRFKGKAVIDVHLMITKPWRYAVRFAEAGADIVNIHVEAGSNSEIAGTLEAIRSAGAIAGLTLKPATSADSLAPFLDKLGLILVMTVEPGFGGQRFMDAQLPKIRTLRRMIDGAEIDCELEVDGGVTPETAKLCVDAGATVLVAGSSVFKAENRAEMINMLKSER